MSDPERLLDHATAAEARLLSAARDEPLPEGLAKRTLAAVSAAGAVTAAAAAADASWKASAAVTAKAAGGGILSAIGIGATLGLLTVGAYQVAVTMGPRAGPNPAPPSVAPVRMEPQAASNSAAPSAAPVRMEPQAASNSSAPSAAPSSSAGARPSQLAAELALLDEARSALRAGDAARARRELDRYAREIPHGQLAREAAMLRAEVDAALDAGATIP
jgi:hypothetical protein